VIGTPSKQKEEAIVSLSAKAMAGAELEAAFDLLRAFLASDAHYRDSAGAYGDRGPEALRHALRLFLARPELGFVWLALDARTVVGCCVVCYAISTSAGAIVAKLDDVCVLPGREGQGIGTALIDSLKAELRSHGVRRIDTSCHVENLRARDFYLRLGFRSLNEERLALVL
jgi:ribosomal protein S18 acetylase RimI-like enzyme